MTRCLFLPLLLIFKSIIFRKPRFHGPKVYYYSQSFYSSATYFFKNHFLAVNEKITLFDKPISRLIFFSHQVKRWEIYTDVFHIA